MSNLTHTIPTPATPSHNGSTLHSAVFYVATEPPEQQMSPRYHVILAGNAFFHIKEISTGHVRGFRSNHNEACALARALECRR
ncbi:hypothetical protein PS645_00500 [Pseudomonas fluorescens]|uniref:Uncharacterized protein n=1 Tax=Pseudomonas fluorescens TaxID=294 RepID=A0A5E6PQU7_PSEFL|nr:hypothetical protein [Pseudomonas fluorescens]VVM45946.1 hypothetical protein PS645_00500 [Pseudomonas fluorescens]